MVVTVINTGGTWNKVYDPRDGSLKVPQDNNALNPILALSFANIDWDLHGIIYKDSLEMTEHDREELCETIKKGRSNKVIIVHGTDTMEETARYLDHRLQKEGSLYHIVLIGAMIPYSIDPQEALFHFGLALGALQGEKQGLFIAMHGLVLPYEAITKNRQMGRFESKLINI